MYKKDIEASNNGVFKIMNMDPLEGSLIQDAGLLQKLAHLHTGRIEDLIAIVESNADDMAQQGSPGMQAPPQAAPGMAPPAGMGPQELLNYEGTNK